MLGNSFVCEALKVCIQAIRTSSDMSLLFGANKAICSDRLLLDASFAFPEDGDSFDAKSKLVFRQTYLLVAFFSDF